MNENRNIPKLRFPKFTEEWEKESFDSAFSSLRNNTLSRADLNDISGKAQDIHYGDVLIKYGDCLDVVKENIPYISDNKTAEKYSDSYLHDGDVVIADTAEDETAGKCTEICDIGGSNVVAGLHTMPVRPMHEFAPGYLGHYLNSHAYHDQLLPLMQGKGTKVTSVPKNSIRKTVIKYPSDINEQRRIGSFFSKIDSIIALHQQYVDQLKEFKKGCLQKMFPKKGEKVPEMRFPGAYNDKGEWAAFIDDWEQRKLSDIGIITTGSTPLTSDNENYGGDYMFVSPADIQDNRYIDQTLTTLTEKGFKSGREIRKGASLFVSIGSTIGKVGQTIEKTVTNQQINAIEPFDDYDDDFIFSLLETQSSGIKAIASNQAVPIVNKTTFSNTSVLLPFTKNEQHKIGEFFMKLDNLITLHQRKLDEMKEFKKGCLQKMFV